MDIIIENEIMEFKKAEKRLQDITMGSEKAKDLVMGSIFSKVEDFSFNEIYDEVNMKIKDENIYVGNIVGRCIDGLLENGLLYKIGNRYKNKR